MGSRIYTKTGDEGTTSLVDGSRIKKNDVRVEAYGAIDETNCHVGLARAYVEDRQLSAALSFVQNRLFNCSSALATPPQASFSPTGLNDKDLAVLETGIDRFERSTGPLKGFILQGGSKCGALLFVACTICRRAERRIVSLAQTVDVDSKLLSFINRCSDFLFAAARYANKIEGVTEASWNKDEEFSFDE